MDERWLKVVVSDIKTKPPKLSGKILISIPKKVIAKAVSRNRIKRVLRVAVLSMIKPQPGQAYYLKVVREPKIMNVHAAKQALEKALG